MTDLKSIKRPSVAMVKLVEATGILLGIPKSAALKSLYKAPTPTNYDDTVEYLSSKFYQAMSTLVGLRDLDISNETASEFYEKVLEPGFNYDDAVRDGGLMSRDLFNVVNYILLKLQSDNYRLPIQKNNIMVLVDGSRPSYVALDLATHIFGHGVCVVGALTIGAHESSMREHLYADISRRCKLQFKLSEHIYRIEAMAVDNADEVVPAVRHAIQSTSSNILVVGMNDWNIGLDSSAQLLLWASWSCPLPVILAKGCSRSRSFCSVVTSRVIQICIKNLSLLKETFTKSLIFLRPGDSVVIVALIHTKGTKADNRETRYEMGSRFNWVVGPQPIVPDFPEEYNDEYIEKMREEMAVLISRAQVQGRVRIIPLSPVRTVSQELCQVAIEESSDIIVMKNSRNRDTITHCARDAPCSIAILK